MAIAHTRRKLKLELVRRATEAYQGKDDVVNHVDGRELGRYPPSDIFQPLITNSVLDAAENTHIFQ